MFARKLVIASLLAASSAPLPGQVSAAGTAALWPHMHKCTINPAVGRHAINTKGTGAAGRAAGAASIPWTRIDLDLAGSPGGQGPAISAHAINTKGTGTSGRAAGSEARNPYPIGSDCDDLELRGDAAAQKAAAADFAFLDPGGKGIGWACSVSGSEDRPQFVIRLLVPPILGQAERLAPARANRAEWSWGASNNRVSIVPHSAEFADSWHVACSSKTPRNTNYDLAVLKK